MATRIEDVYKRYPEAKLHNETNVKFHDDPETYDPNEESCFDVCVKLYDCDDELYNFLYSLCDYDGFLLKQNEIMPSDYIRSEKKIKSLMVEHLNTNLDDIWWMSDEEDENKWPDYYKGENGA